jgi:polyphosphate kinase 2 (PPK2 family)
MQKTEISLTDRLVVKPGTKVDLGEWGPDFTAGYKSKKEALQILADNKLRLADFQYKLYAENHRAVLIILQAMDAGGKDGVRGIPGRQRHNDTKVLLVNQQRRAEEALRSENQESGQELEG